MRWRLSCIPLVLGLLLPRPGAAFPQTARQLADDAYGALRHGQRARAAALLEQALDRVRRPDLEARLARDLGYLLEALGRHRDAAGAFARAARIAPDAPTFRALGYAALAAGDTGRAIDAFEAARVCDPDDPTTLRQLGYLYQRIGARRRAAAAFRAAMRTADAAGEANPERRLLLRREVRALGKRIDGGLALLWRRDGPSNAPLTVGGRVLSQSQGLAGIDGRLPWPRLGAGRWLAGSGRLLWALDGDRPTPRAESLQAGIGLKFKPFAHETLILGVERLIAVGALARDDWLLRASWSRGAGLEAPPGHRSWLFWSLYGDVALIDPGDPDLQLSGAGRLGWGRQFGPFVLLPHLQLSTLIVDDSGGTTSLVEGGPALEVVLPFGGDRFRAAPHALALVLAYRARIAGTSRNRSGATLSLALRF